MYTFSICTTFHRYPIFSTRYSVMCKVYTGYCGTSEIEHGLCACTVDNPLAKARGLSLRTGAQPMLYLPLIPSPTHHMFSMKKKNITAATILSNNSSTDFRRTWKLIVTVILFNYVCPSALTHCILVDSSTVVC